jgi:hypothetical protein
MDQAYNADELTQRQRTAYRIFINEMEELVRTY